MASPFGNNPFATNPFGSTQPGAMFGSSTTASPFVQQQPLFGQNASTMSASSPFGSSSVSSGAFSSGPGTFGITNSDTEGDFKQTSSPFGLNQSANLSSPSPYSLATGNAQSTPGLLSSQTGGAAFSTSSSSGASLFGQMPGFNQSSTATGLFGQSSAPSGTPFTQPPAYSPFGTTLAGQTATTSVTGFAFASSSPFGQNPSPFSQTSTSSASLPFAQTSSVFVQSSAPTVSPFGQTALLTASPFGQTTMSAASPFGQTALSTASPFGQTTMSAASPFGQTALSTASSFGQTTMSAASPFGQASSSAASPFGQVSASATFGQQSSSAPFGQLSSQAPSSLSSSSGLFNRPIPPSTKTSTFQQLSTVAAPVGSTSATAAVSTLFGKPFTSASSGSFPSTALASSSATSLFGKPVNPTLLPSSSASLTEVKTIGVKKEEREPYQIGGSAHSNKPEPFSSAPLFASGGSSVNASIFGIKKEGNADVKQEPGTLFGKVVNKSVTSASNSQEQKPSGLFGKGLDQKQNAQSGVGGTTGGLFGKEKVELRAGSGFFRKRDMGSEGQQKEQGKEESAMVRKEAHERGVVETGKRANERSGVGRGERGRMQIRRLSTSSDTRSPATRGLFGKPPPPGAERREGRQQLTRQLSEDAAGKVAIVCKNVPTRFNSNITLRRHFERFGTVSKVFPNSKNQQATVHFTTHEAAAEAKRRGRVLAKGVPPLTIFWSSYVAKPPRSTSDDEQTTSWTGKRDSVKQTSTKTWKAGSAVDDELASMSGAFAGPSTGGSGRTVPGRSAPGQERKQRSVSPVPATVKPGEKVTRSMFEGAVGATAADRVSLLNLRDKYIRQHKQKKKDMVAAFVGTCPDKCPEKERYYREEIRRLHPYEIIPGTENIPGRNPQVDHRRAVKEYLRSTPDQDEPLLHELRPISSLQETMTYLLKEVVPKGEDGRWGDWFDYLWNRTRGIRKDITQQQLCDRGAVDLIEKCARFHIFCSERLCEEDMYSFDAKINNENLTKCLQTLREFYTDLEKKQKQFCTSEAEFRAYLILMNLNQGDILRETQQLRSEVRSSPEIKFALKVYFSLNNNNYIRFFRLLNEASFANACIMHRYFTQIRNKALQLMMKGYSMGRTAAQIPLYEFVRLLSFEDEGEAGDFCRYFGFPVSDGEVTLDRTEYIEPETAWEPRRSIKIIEAKLHVSVGEMIYGSSFPNYEMEGPRSSFDANGRFYSAIPLPDDPITSVQEAKPEPVISPAPPQSVVQESVQPVTKEAQPVPQEVQPPRPKFTNDSIKDIAKILFGEVINEMCRNIGDEVMCDVNSQLQLSTSYVDRTIQETLYEEIREISKAVIEEAEIAKTKALQKEKEERQGRVARTLADELLEDVLFHQVQGLADDQMSQVNEELRKESEMRSTASISTEMVDTVLSDMISAVAEDVFEVDVRQRIKQLDEFESIIKLARTARFLEKWKKEYKAVTKLKRAMQDFPSASNMAGVDATFKELAVVNDERVVDGQFYITKRARLTVESAYEVTKRRKMTETKVTVNMLYQKMLRQIAFHPLDLTRIIGRPLLDKWRQKQSATRKARTLYWKLLVCLPEVIDSTDPAYRATKHLCEWLTTKLMKGITPRIQSCEKTRALSVYKCPISPTIIKHPCQEPAKLGVCVRTVTGTLSEDDVEEIQEERHFLGTSGLMFMLPADAQLSKPDSPFWVECRDRLQGILGVKPVPQNVPLVVIVPTNGEVSFLELLEHLSLDDLVGDNILGAIHFAVLKLNKAHPKGVDVVNPDISEKICEGIKWLGEQTILPQTLTVRYLKDCIEDCLLRFYHTPVQQNLKQRRLLRHLDKDPQSLIELYNSVIQHVASTLTADKLASMSWPIPEFWRETLSDLPPAHWNSEDHFEYLYSFIMSLALPQFYIEHPGSEEWTDTQTDIWTFISYVAGPSHGSTKVDFYSRVRQLLHQVEIDIEETCYLVEGEESCLPSYISVPWSRLISLCIDFRLRTVDFTDPDLVSMQSNVDLTEMKVAYHTCMLDKFTPPATWGHIESEKSILDTPSLDQTIQRAAEKVRLQQSQDQSITKTEVSIVEPDNSMSLKLQAKKESSLLINSLTNQRRKSEKFLNFLENALKDDEVDLTADSFSGSPLENSRTVAMETRDFSMSGNHRRLSFDATSYFGQGQGNISAIFDKSYTGSIPPSSIGSSRRQSLEELTTLPGSKRLQRMSELFGDDPVMMWLKKPKVTEDMQLLKDQLKATRRRSDIFEKKLKQTLATDLI